MSIWNQSKSGLDVTKIVKIYVKIYGILKSATFSTFTQKSMKENSETTVSFSRKDEAKILRVNNQRVLTTKPLKDVVLGLLMYMYVRKVVIGCVRLAVDTTKIGTPEPGFFHFGPRLTWIL